MHVNEGGELTLYEYSYDLFRDYLFVTDAMDASGSDEDLVRAAVIAEAYHEIAAGGTLRVQSETGATQPKATCYVLGVRVA